MARRLGGRAGRRAGDTSHPPPASTPNQDRRIQGRTSRLATGDLLLAKPIEMRPLYNRTPCFGTIVPDLVLEFRSVGWVTGGPSDCPEPAAEGPVVSSGVQCIASIKRDLDPCALAGADPRRAKRWPDIDSLSSSRQPSALVSTWWLQR